MAQPQLSSPKVVLDLMTAGRRLEFKAGTVIYREGDAVRDVYCVATGNVVVTRHTESGDRQLLGMLFPGDYLGTSFAPVHNVGAEALTDAGVWALPQADLRRALASRPELGAAFAEMAANILNSALDHVFTLGRKNARARVASFLLYLRRRQERLALPTDRLQVPMTRQDIADFLGLTMETVSRSFSQLKAGGSVRPEGPNEVVVIDAAKLRQEAEQGLSPTASRPRRSSGG